MASTRYVVHVKIERGTCLSGGADIFEKGIRQLLKNIIKPVKENVGNEYSCSEKRGELDHAFYCQCNDHPLVTFGRVQPSDAEYDGKEDHEDRYQKAYVYAGCGIACTVSCEQ